MSILCNKCREEIHPRRIKALPNTRVCVKCSTEGTYKALSTINGEGDHTWNDIQIISDEDCKILDRNSKKDKPIKFSEEWEKEDEDRNLQGPFIILKD